MTRGSANVRTTASVSSVEQSSTTRSSKSSKVCASTLATAAPRNRAPWYVGTATETRGTLTGSAAIAPAGVAAVAPAGRAGSASAGAEFGTAVGASAARVASRNARPKRVQGSRCAPSAHSFQAFTKTGVSGPLASARAITSRNQRA